MNPRVFVGLDVNRSGIRAAVRPTGQEWMACSDDGGINETADRLFTVEPAIVVMEAQGGIELPVAGTLAAAGLPVALVPSRHVRDFARSIRRPRDHQSQASLLACFAELVQPEVRAMPAHLVETLKILKARRREILDVLALERSRQEIPCAAVQRDIRNHIGFLEKGVVALGEEINRAIRSSSMWL